jgi:hypothetical protein
MKHAGIPDSKSTIVYDLLLQAINDQKTEPLNTGRWIPTSQFETP